MKRIFNIITIFAIAMLAVSCQKDLVTYNDGYDDGLSANGAPTISGVYDIKDQTTAITQGALQQMIVIKGANLSGVKSIKFNDVDVDLKTVYAKSAESYLPIPRVLPTNVTNKLIYTTDLGTVEYDFVVNIPEIEIEGLYNEFALPGDTVQVVGKYFDLYGFGTDAATITMNGADITIDSITAEYMSIIIPANAADNSTITFNSTEMASAITIPYRGVSSIIWDLSNPSACGLWAGTEYITTGTNTGDPEKLYGDYIRINGSYGAWSWINLPCGGFNLTADAAANPADYYFKFEVNSATNTPFYDSQSAGYIFQVNGGWYVWNPSASVSFNTYGQWRTIRLELNEMGALPAGGGWTNLFLILQPNNDWSVDHSFANYRIEKKM